MAVDEVTLVWQGQTGGWSQGGTREYTAVYQVKTTDPLDGPQVVLSADDLPAINDPYEVGNDSDTSAFCRRLTPSRIDGNRMVWQVTAQFGTANTASGTDSNGNPTDNPLDFREEWEVGWSNRSVPVEKAFLYTELTGIPLNADPFKRRPVVNSAGVKYDPPLEKDASLMTIRITKYREVFPNDHLLFTDTINSDEFTLSHRGFFKVVLPYRAKALVSGALQFQNNVEFWRMTYELLIDDYSENGWRQDVVDRGLEAFVGPGTPDGKGGNYTSTDMDNWPQGTAKVRRLEDAYGNPLTTPVLFDGMGQPAEPTADPFYIVYAIYFELDFNDLNL